MSRHPYYIVQDLLKHACRFVGCEQQFFDARTLGYPVTDPLHETEEGLATSGYWIDKLYEEYRERIAETAVPALPIPLRRVVERISEIVQTRLRNWGWDDVAEPGWADSDPRSSSSPHRDHQASPSRCGPIVAARQERGTARSGRRPGGRGGATRHQADDDPPGRRGRDRGSAPGLARDAGAGRGGACSVPRRARSVTPGGRRASQAVLPGRSTRRASRIPRQEHEGSGQGIAPGAG